MHIRRKVKNRGRKRDGLDDTVVTGRENIETNYKKKMQAARDWKMKRNQVERNE